MCPEIQVTLLITTRRRNRFMGNNKIRATDSCDKRPKDTEKQKKPVLINKYYKIRELKIRGDQQNQDYFDGFAWFDNPFSPMKCWMKKLLSSRG